MPCHVRATRTSSRRRLSSQPPTTIAASLDLGVPGERDAHELLLRFVTGRHPIWRLLSMRRSGAVLQVAVEWLRSREPRRFSVVDVSLDEPMLCWSELESEQAALAALRESSMSPDTARGKAA